MLRRPTYVCSALQRRCRSRKNVLCRITAQEAVVGAVTEQAARARDLPGPKRRFGIDNLRVNHFLTIQPDARRGPLSIQP